MKRRLGILSTRWGWQADLLLFKKLMGPVSFQWDIEPYWQIRIKNLYKKTCKQEPRNISNV